MFDIGKGLYDSLCGILCCCWHWSTWKIFINNLLVTLSLMFMYFVQVPCLYEVVETRGSAGWCSRRSGSPRLPHRRRAPQIVVLLLVLVSLLLFLLDGRYSCRRRWLRHIRSRGHGLKQIRKQVEVVAPEWICTHQIVVPTIWKNNVIKYAFLLSCN